VNTATMLFLLSRCPDSYRGRVTGSTSERFTCWLEFSWWILQTCFSNWAGERKSPAQFQKGSPADWSSAGEYCNRVFSYWAGDPV